MASAHLLLVVMFLVILCSIAAPPRYLPIRLFRVLLPSWRFFENTCELPGLFYRIKDDNAEFGEWRDALPPVPRSGYQIFFNPWGNALLAFHGIVQQLATDVSELKTVDTAEIANLISYQLTRRLVRFQITRHDGLMRPFQYQFKLRSKIQGRPESEAEDVLFSLTHEA